MIPKLKRYCRDTSGATSIEYGLILTLMAVAIIASMTTLGTNVKASWGKVADNMK
jgi:pilus assembly protein Flp/PilA